MRSTCVPCVYHVPGAVQCNKALIQVARTGCIHFDSTKKVVKPKTPKADK